MEAKPNVTVEEGSLASLPAPPSRSFSAKIPSLPSSWPLQVSRTRIFKTRYYFGTGIVSVTGASFATISIALSFFAQSYANGVKLACPEAFESRVQGGMLADSISATLAGLTMVSPLTYLISSLLAILLNAILPAEVEKDTTTTTPLMEDDGSSNAASDSKAEPTAENNPATSQLPDLESGAEVPKRSWNQPGTLFGPK
ncbi:hypothetical protein NDA13_004952 [Ustilago tritici]|nr:hypothetical protein NDA13_004952 [Ustilago tritici]